MKKIKKKKVKWNVSEIKMLFWGSLSLQLDCSYNQSPPISWFKTAQIQMDDD